MELAETHFSSAVSSPRTQVDKTTLTVRQIQIEEIEKRNNLTESLRASRLERGNRLEGRIKIKAKEIAE